VSLLEKADQLTSVLRAFVTVFAGGHFVHEVFRPVSLHQVIN